jgi:oligopeptide transport system permease protein
MRVLATLGISFPSFILAVFLQYTLAVKLGLFPIARWGTLSQMVLPTLSLAALPTAYIARMTRANMIEVLHQDYIKAAKAKGLRSFQILFSHCYKNALLPLVGYFGQLVTVILVGSFIIEKIYSIPGLGRWYVLSVLNRDYPLIMGTTIFFSAILLFSGFIADIFFKILDPRMRLQTTFNIKG